LLLRLPLLERLDADLALCTRFDFLVALTRLVSLTLSLSGIEVNAWSNLLAVFTSDGLTRLHTLDLWNGPCSSDDLVQILSQSPSLTHLTLDTLPAVASLSFFDRLPKLARTLTHLTIVCYQSAAWNTDDLLSLLVLRQLRVLRLLKWPDGAPQWLTAVDLAPFEQRPSAALPHLDVFELTRQQSLF
jgi:hypothetical protein